MLRDQNTINDIYYGLENRLFENPSISSEVENQFKELKRLCKSKSQHWLYNFELPSFRIFDMDFKIIFHLSYLKSLDGPLGCANINDKTLDLYYYVHFPQQFDDTLMHELPHIYQYSKNKETHQSDKYYVTARRILDNRYDYSPNDVMFAYALYISFDFEQDAMVHGLYGYLKNMYSINPRTNIYECKEYAFLLDMQISLEMIEKDQRSFNENLFGINVDCYYHRIKKSKERYQKKINRIVKLIQLQNDEHHLSECFVHQMYHRKTNKYRHDY